MSETTRLLMEIEQGVPGSSEQLFPVVYDELRRLASEMLAREKPGQTLQTTALVHEAYVRLVDRDAAPQWSGKRHFFAAAAEAMRRILVENARRKLRAKHGGDFRRVPLDEDAVSVNGNIEELLAVNEAIAMLADEDPAKAELVKLRAFAGLTLKQAADVLGISRATASRHWSYARAWLYEKVRDWD